MFLVGCESCLSSQSAMQERLLRYEVLVQVGSLVATALACVCSPCTKKYRCGESAFVRCVVYQKYIFIPSFLRINVNCLHVAVR